MTDLLTARDAAKALGVSPRTIARWAEDGRLEPMFKHDGLRGALLFTADAVEAARDAS